MLVPEHIIGLKVQAIANNPSRKAQDLADIEFLLELYEDKLDWSRIREDFSPFDMTDLAVDLENKYGVDQ